MPRVNEAPAESILVKLLLMAYSKGGKTHYAAEAAKGFLKYDLLGVHQDHE